MRDLMFISKQKNICSINVLFFKVKCSNEEKNEILSILKFMTNISLFDLCIYDNQSRKQNKISCI